MKLIRRMESSLELTLLVTRNPWLHVFLPSAVPGVQRKGDAYLVQPEIFRRDLCAKFDPEMVLRILGEQGYLEHDPGRLEKSVRLSGAGTKRVYSIKASIVDQPSRVSTCGANSGNSGNGGDNWSKAPQAIESSVVIPDART